MNFQRLFSFALITGILAIWTACIPTQEQIRINQYERPVISLMTGFVSDQVHYHANHGTYGSIEELKLNGRIDSRVLSQYNEYRFEITAAKDRFEIRATPLQYSWKTKRSFYANSKDGHIRGADHQGRPANETDPVTLANPSTRVMPQ